ncbi:polysaccharide deacetylase family protein [Candidatus Wolfebacteria bacterium]|nr:polysaccharide deacetylase family protein [Candidatus Wolfebacteria bacterium]
MLKKNILSKIRIIDSFIGNLYVNIIGERSSLIGFLFHGTLQNREENNRNLVDPQQQITINDLRIFIQYYLNQGYKFISPDDLARGLADGKYAMITFDDGYYNNISVLPLLHEFQVPATFFITTSCVKEQKGFWWDVLYRERKYLGWADDKIAAERQQLKQKQYSEIHEYITGVFGAAAWKPIGDIDRPFNPQELRAFSEDPFVHIGNHTRDHAILTNYDYGEMVEQLRGAQEDLIGMVGYAPKIVAYPNGRYSDKAVFAAKEAGLELGMTVDQHKNYFSGKKRNNNKVFLFGRFILWGNRDIFKQCFHFRYDGQLSIERAIRSVRKILKKLGI